MADRSIGITVRSSSRKKNVQKRRKSGLAIRKLNSFINNLHQKQWLHFAVARWILIECKHLSLVPSKYHSRNSSAWLLTLSHFILSDWTDSQLTYSLFCCPFNVNTFTGWRVCYILKCSSVIYRMKIKQMLFFLTYNFRCHSDLQEFRGTRHTHRNLCASADKCGRRKNVSSLIEDSPFLLVWYSVMVPPTICFSSNFCARITHTCEFARQKK